MITGALSLKKKTAGQVMTRLEDVFMLSIKTILDFETVSSIQKKGYSRIPIYEEERKNVVALFHAKDLAFVDPNDNMPIRTLIEFYRHPTLYTFDDTPLDDVLKMFKEGKSHLAFVKQVYEPESQDPVHEITGIVTLEDVIEEILQTEIVDETDTLSDNRMKRRRKDIHPKDYSDFAKIGGGLGRDTVVSPQMALASFQFLSCAVDAFKEPIMSAATLRKLMAQKVYFTVRVSQDDDDEAASDDTPDNDHSVNLYKEGSPADFFILVIEGRVRVTVGREKLVFVSGPFSYFGLEALKLDQDSFGSTTDFVPDYSVDAIETTTFLKITRSVYLYAYRANEMENSLLRSSTLGNTDADSGLLSICVSESNASHTTNGSSISITVTPTVTATDTTSGRVQTISGDVVKFDKPSQEV